jgi:hypothetical protein
MSYGIVGEWYTNHQHPCRENWKSAHISALPFTCLVRNDTSSIWIHIVLYCAVQGVWLGMGQRAQFRRPICYHLPNIRCIYLPCQEAINLLCWSLYQQAHLHWHSNRVINTISHKLLANIEHLLWHKFYWWNYLLLVPFAIAIIIGNELQRFFVRRETILSYNG